MENLVHKIKRPDRWDQPYGNPVSDSDVLNIFQYEPFSLISPSNFPKNRSFELIAKNDGRMRKFKAGEIVTLQGDASNSCYLLLEGELRIILLKKDSEKALNKPIKKYNIWNSLKQLWNNHDINEYRDTKTYISSQSLLDERGHAIRMIENPDDIIKNSKTVVMEPGQFFGEVAALSRSTRSASIFAETDVLVYELRWQGLRDIRMWDSTFRLWVDQLFHQRSFLPLFTKNPLLAQMSDVALEKTAKSSGFQAYGDQSWYKKTGKLSTPTTRQNNESNVLIVGEGQHLDGLYLIRGGFVQVTKTYGNGERTVGYLISNDLYGLTGILSRENNPNDAVQSRYNLYALGYVDLLVIPTETVIRYLIPHWQKSKALDDIELLKRAAPMYVTETEEPQLPQALLETLFEQRTINGSATMVIDNNSCIGCDECIRACANAHDNNPRFIRHGSNYSHFTFANACMHCIDPVCLSDCPTGAIHRPSEHSIVQINDSACIGCSNCANSCPYDNIRMVEVKDANDQPIIDANTQKPLIKATKCDLCNEQITGPACESACSYDALKRINFSNRKEVSQWFTERY